MFLPNWIPGGFVAHQCMELSLSVVIGVLLYYVPLCIVKKKYNAEEMTRFNSMTKAVASGLVFYSCFALLQPHFSDIIHPVASSPDILYFLAGVAVGGGVLFQIYHHFEDANSNAATAAMLAHSLVEGSGLGLMVGSPGFFAIFRSQVIHGVPDGMLVAMVSLEYSGPLKAILLALLARLGFILAFCVTAFRMSPISGNALQVAEGVALGSMAAMLWQEFGEIDAKNLDKKKAAFIAFATAALCFLLLG